MFALKLLRPEVNKNSFVTIGGYDKELVGGKEIKWMSTMDNYSWVIPNSYFGPESDRAANYSDSFEISTAQSRLRLKSSTDPHDSIVGTFKVLIRYLPKSLECMYDEWNQYVCYVESESYEQFPTLAISLCNGTVVLKLLPDDYVIFVSPIRHTVGSRVQDRACYRRHPD